MIEHLVHIICAGIRLSQYTDIWTCHIHTKSGTDNSYRHNTTTLRPGADYDCWRPGWNLERCPISNEEDSGKCIYFGIGISKWWGPSQHPFNPLLLQTLIQAPYTNPHLHHTYHHNLSTYTCPTLVNPKHNPFIHSAAYLLPHSSRACRLHLTQYLNHMYHIYVHIPHSPQHTSPVHTLTHATQTIVHAPQSSQSPNHIGYDGNLIDRPRTTTLLQRPPKNTDPAVKVREISYSYYTGQHIRN